MNQHLPHSSVSTQAGSLANIYKPDINIASWCRSLTRAHQDAAHELVSKTSACPQVSEAVDTRRAFDCVIANFGDSDATQLIAKDASELVEMFSILFDVDQVGLRLRILDKAMCPKFHVDRVHCRLVTTYTGLATEWLCHNNELYSRLTQTRNRHQEFDRYLSDSGMSIQRLAAGDVALLKGEAWEGNENRGLMHRSPSLEDGERRLLLTVDLI